MEIAKFEINSEVQFYKFVDKLESDGKITTDEADAMCNFVCGALDNLCMCDEIEDEDF